MRVHLSWLVALSLACRADDTDEAAEARALARTTDGTARSGALLQMILGGAGYSGTPAEAAADKLCSALAEQLEARLTLPDRSGGGSAVCTDRSVEPACEPVIRCSDATLTASFDGCTGPYGLAEISGSITAELSVEPAGEVVVMSAEVSSEDLSVAGVSIAIDASVTSEIEQLPGEDAEAAATPLPVVTLEVTDHIEIGGDEPVSQDGQMTIEADPATHCVSVTGGGDVSWKGLSYTYSVSDETRCAGACSSSGVSLWTSDTSQIRLESNGTAAAPWQGGQRSGTAPLECRPRDPHSAAAAADLYGTAWSCTGVQSCLELYAPAPTSSGDIDAVMTFGDGTRSCAASVHAEGFGAEQVVQIDDCSFWSGTGVTLMEHSWSGLVPDYYDMIGSYRVYNSSGYWGSLPSLCEPFTPAGRD